MAEPPRQSPRPPEPHDDEPKTDPGLFVQSGYVKEKLHGLAVRMSAGVVVAAVGVVFAVFFALEARAEKLIEQRVAPIEREQSGLEKHVDKLDQKVDLVLDALRVPLWVRPAPFDGGSP